MFRDVIVQSREPGCFVVLDREPRRPGELVTLERIVNDVIVTTPVRIVACRPVLKAGAVLHELQLVQVNDDA